MCARMIGGKHASLSSVHDVHYLRHRGRHARQGARESASLYSPPCPFPTHAVKQDRGGRSVRCLNRADPTMDTKRKLRVLRVSLEARSLLRVAPLVRLLLLRTSSSDYVHKLDCAFAPRCRPIFRTHPETHPPFLLRPACFLELANTSTGLRTGPAGC